MPTWQRYKPSLAVRVLVWPFSIALATGYVLATRTIYRAAMSLLPASLVWAAMVTAVAVLVRWVVLANLGAKRAYVVIEDEVDIRRSAA
jgi:hypothetical protein